MSALAVVCLFAAPVAAWASPRTLPYQGIIERDGVPQTGTFDLRFAIFRDVVTDASCLTANVLGSCGIWAEEQSAVAVTGGRFGVSLGSVTSLSPGVFRAGEPFLAVAVRGPGDPSFTLLGGRQRLGTVPFAIRSEVALPPIGSVIAWHKSMAGVPALDPDDGWVECNGQTIVDAASPLNGQIVPDLNGGRRFLRGGSRSGDLQADALQLHRHDDAGHTHSFTRPFWGAQGEMPNGTVLNLLSQGPPFVSHTQVVSTGHAVIGTPTDDTAQDRVRADTETRPANMSVVWIMRIK